nr:EamA family transporter [uncultured Flavobacterium sp.]
MLYILLSICCSVSVAVLLKTGRRFNISIQQIINWNYLSALLLCFFAFSPDTAILQTNAPWRFYVPLMILLPTIFVFMALSIKYIGIVKTDIAQRLSLFIPIIASVFIFGETIGLLKMIGLIVGFLAIFLTLNKKSEHSSKIKKWIFPVIVLVGFGVIDILFKQIALNTEIPFTTSLFVIFCGAFLLATCITVYSIVMNRTKLASKNFYFGIVLGLLNFGNIFFYLKAHKALSDNPSTVFATMNFGVIILGSLIGIVAFKEKISKINYTGIALALLAVVIITYSQLNPG